MEGYTLHGVLGRGAHGEVHRAEAIGRPGRIVAVKRFTDAPSPAQIREVRREAELLQQLSHPSIVQLLDVAPDGDGVALVTPFLPGGTLAARIARGSLPPAAVADLGARLGDALAAVHGAGIVHGDVKPANVIYDAEEQPLLTDFGAAVLVGDLSVETVGTATYLDPEVAAGRATAGPVSDQYALGVLLYEALAGAPPYGAPTVDATLRIADRGVHAPLADLAPDAPDAMVAAIERAISRSPTDRFGTVRDLASVLEEVRTGLDTWIPPPPGAADRSWPTDPPADDGPEPGRAVPAPADLPPPPPTDPGPRRDVPFRPAPQTSPPTPDASPPRAAPLPTGRGLDAASQRDPDQDPTRTRRFGPAPPRPAEPESDEQRSRVPLILVAIVVLLVPIGVVAALWFSGGEDEPITTTPTEPPEPDPPLATPPDLPACEDAPPLPDDAGDTVAADTDGRGCTIDLGWDPDEQVLTVPREDDDPLRYQLGEPGDVLVVGAWDCDGRQTPGLYRPDSGEVFLFDGFAGDGGQLDSRPAEDSGVTGGEPVVLRDEDGCDQIEVRDTT